MADENKNEKHYEGQAADSRQRIVLSEDELRVLKECNQESFWYRCVPLGIVFIGSTQILVNKGFLNPNPRFGAMFKNMGAALAAFIIGKMSYQGQCREKILRLENSALAESMRQGKRGVELVKEMSSLPAASYDHEGGSNVRESEFQNLSRHRDIEGNTVEAKGLDDSRRPSMDRETLMFDRPEEQASVDKGLSYEELRTKNRIDYEQKLASSRSTTRRGQGQGQETSANSKPYSSSTYMSESSPGSSASASASSYFSGETESSAVPKGAKQNKYGDILE